MAQLAGKDKGRSDPGRCSVFVLDAEPFGGAGHPADRILRTRRYLSGRTTRPKRSTKILRPWPSLALFLEEGNVCLSNNAVEQLGKR